MNPVEFLPAEIERLQYLVKDHIEFLHTEGDIVLAKSFQATLKKFERYQKYEEVYHGRSIS